MDLALNLKPAGLKSVGDSRFTVRLDEKAVASLPAMAKKKTEKLKDLKMRLLQGRDGKTVLDASAEVLVSGRLGGLGEINDLPVPVEVVGARAQ